MKLLYAFLILAVVLVSCSTPKELYDKGLGKIEKAIERDPSLVFPKDTIRVVEYDTIHGADGKDSIIIRKETIQLPCDFDVDALLAAAKEKSGRELRFERRTSKDSLKHLEKMYKLETNRLQDSLNFQKKLNKELTKRLDDITDTNVKLEKEKTKQEKGSWFQRQMGKIWWLLIIISLIAGFLLRNLIPKIPNPFKNIRDGT